MVRKGDFQLPESSSKPQAAFGDVDPTPSADGGKVCCMAVCRTTTAWRWSTYDSVKNLAVSCVSQ